MIKKAILTGGGHATRLRPITTTINKHLIPLANKPMIFHAIDKVVEIGVKEIFININLIFQSFSYVFFRQAYYFRQFKLSNVFYFSDAWIY